MSVDPWAFQRWAFEQPTGNPVRKAVLAMLAMMADASNGRGEVKQGTLAAGIEVTDRAVRGHLKALEEAGVISRRPQFRRDRGRRGDEFLLLAPWVTEWPDGEPVFTRNDVPGGATGTDDPGGAERSFRGPRNAASGQELPLGDEPLPNPTATQSAVDHVWEHYQAARKVAIPRSNGCKLSDAEKRVIRNALKVRSAEDCKAAIDGLFRSDYHVQGGYIGIKYALLGGGRSPDPATTIDRLANGHGSGSRLKDRTYRGLSFDELTPAVQANAREAASMGLEVWDGGKDAWADREQQEAAQLVAFAARRNGHAGVVTADNFADV